MNALSDDAVSGITASRYDIHTRRGIISGERTYSRRRTLSSGDADDAAPYERVTLSTGETWALRLPTQRHDARDHIPRRKLTALTPRDDVFARAEAFLFANATLYQWMITLKPPHSDDTVRRVNAILRPHRLDIYLPHNTWTLVAPEYVALRARNDPHVLAVREVHYQMKSDADLMQNMLQRRSTSTRDALRLTLIYPLLHSAGAELLRSPYPIRDSANTSVTASIARSWQKHWRKRIAATNVSSSLLEFAAIDSHHVAVNVVRSLSDVRFDGDGASFLEFLIDSLSAHSLVHFIAPAPTFHTMNRHAKWLTQTSSVNYSLPAYDVGLHGEGVVIAMGDTGVDADSCFFYDPDVPLPVNTINFQHRKIVTYITTNLAGKQTKAPWGDSEGHGTHTAGTVAGDAMDFGPTVRSIPADDILALSQYNGVAYKAKLLIHDFANENDPNLYVPNDVYNDYLSKIVEIGAHMSSNSWGDDKGQYDDYSQSVDRFLYKHPHHLMIMAAGNEGSKGRAKIGTPACAKNVLTVGAHLNHPDSFRDAGIDIGVAYSSPTHAQTYHAVIADFGPRLPTERAHVDAAMCVANPLNACAQLVNSETCRGAVILTLRGDCKFYLKAANVQAFGGVAMIVVTTVDADDHGKPFPMPTDNEAPTIVVPALMVAHTADALLTLTDDEQRKVKFTFPVALNADAFDVNRLASFSSRGPTVDGRIKPDVLAPGEKIQSSYSTKRNDDYQCDPRRNGNTLRALQGTSMATPVAAGNAAIVRQYFTDGYYMPPDGPITTPPTSAERRQLYGFDPTSALIKGVLMHSSQSITSEHVSYEQIRRDPSLQPAPSVYQGHGRIQLDSALPFQGARAGFTLFVNDNASIRSLATHVYCFRVRPQRFSDNDGKQMIAPFKATLSWTDPPGPLQSSFILLNQLDLLVSFDPDDDDDARSIRRVWIGNAHDIDGGNATETLQWDTNNNHEKVIIRHPRSGRYTVVVRGTHIVESPQRYALIVTGQFDDANDTSDTAHRHTTSTACPAHIRCPNACSGHGVCVTSAAAAVAAGINSTHINDGACRCDSHYAAADCSVAAQRLEPDTVVTATVIPNEWAYYYFDADRSTSLVSFKIVRTSPSGDPDFYLTSPRRPGYPTLAYYDVADTQFDDHMKPQPPTHWINISKPALNSGTYMLAVWGYCCEQPNIDIRLFTRREDHVEKDALQSQSQSSALVAIVRLHHSDDLTVVSSVDTQLFLRALYQSIVERALDVNTTVNVSVIQHFAHSSLNVTSIAFRLLIVSADGNIRNVRAALADFHNKQKRISVGAVTATFDSQFIPPFCAANMIGTCTNDDESTVMRLAVERLTAPQEKQDMLAPLTSALNDADGAMIAYFVLSAVAFALVTATFIAFYYYYSSASGVRGYAVIGQSFAHHPTSDNDGIPFDEQEHNAVISHDTNEQTHTTT